MTEQSELLDALPMTHLAVPGVTFMITAADLDDQIKHLEIKRDGYLHSAAVVSKRIEMFQRARAKVKP